MVTIEQLEAFDALIWLRSGIRASKACLCDESTITRRVRAVLKVFDLSFDKSRRFELLGDQRLLRMERRLHQRARYCMATRRGALRLDVSLLQVEVEAFAATEGWFVGRSLFMEADALLDLLRNSVVDAVLVADVRSVDVFLNGLSVIHLSPSDGMGAEAGGWALLVLSTWIEEPSLRRLVEHLKRFVIEGTGSCSLALLLDSSSVEVSA